MNRRIIKYAIVLLVLLALAFFCWWQNNGLTVTRYQLSSDRVPDGLDGYTIVQVSDLHNKLFGGGQAGLLEKIAQAEPDLIVITGDIIDRTHTELEPALALARGAAALAPVYYVTGNHEFSVDSSDYTQLMVGLGQAGVVLLDDQTRELALPGGVSLVLTGLSDRSLRDDTLTRLAEGWPEGEGVFRVLLAHEPQYVERYAASGADLVFCGHAHGGQIRLPWIGGLFAPGQGVLPRYTSGLYPVEHTTMVVSRGIGNSVFPLRLFNRPEVVVLTLNAQ